MHALLARARDAGGGPLTAAEVCEYDSEAVSVVSTGAALAWARRYGLVDSWRAGREGRVWSPSNRAAEMRWALEDRFLREVPDECSAASGTKCSLGQLIGSESNVSSDSSH